ncbi:uncharacterized protein LOC110985910 isoform X2 [Acanthaster planci]|uniref:Uncharacterized protein LOC110985910 isoform X2 n=1 Tax=Acanthaster planci TaxID=133434 RepID=A0A8B7ZEA3_ACAPL|nr:uncharacterized protein LOC110985910 isoform X2 [Acanthaster planci]
MDMLDAKEIPHPPKEACKKAIASDPMMTTIQVFLNIESTHQRICRRGGNSSGPRNRRCVWIPFARFSRIQLSEIEDAFQIKTQEGITEEGSTMEPEENIEAERIEEADVLERETGDGKMKAQAERGTDQIEEGDMQEEALRQETDGGTMEPEEGREVEPIVEGDMQEEKTGQETGGDKLKAGEDREDEPIEGDVQEEAHEHETDVSKEDTSVSLQQATRRLFSKSLHHNELSERCKVQPVDTELNMCGKCKKLNPTKRTRKQHKKIKWICCCTCCQWFHQECINLKVSAREAAQMHFQCEHCKTI